MILRRVAIGFLAGLLAVLTFHQATIGILNAYGLVGSAPFRTAAVGPLEVPAFLNQAFWGGVWGIVIALLTDALRSERGRVVAAMLVGAIGATAVGWFVVAPIKGLPIAQGWNPAAMWRAPLINGVFGLGVGLILPGLWALFSSRR